MTSSKLGLLAALSLAAALAAVAQAAVFNVDTTVDDPVLAQCSDAAPNDCSLRGAIIKANARTEPVTINVPAGTYTLSSNTGCAFRGNAFGVFWQTQALCPVGTVTIVGAGSDTTIFDAAQPTGSIGIRAPVMIVATTGNVIVRGVTMRRGNFSGGSFEGHGGGINNAGVLVLEDAAITENWSGASGGGIYNQGSLTLTRTVVARNFAGQIGGGIINTNLAGSCPTSPCHLGEGLLTIVDSSISNNVATLGGGIFNYVGMVDVASSTIDGNVASSSGGGLYNAAWNMALTNVTVSGNRAASGGGIVNQGPTFSTMQLNNVTITRNVAQWDSDPGRGIGGGLTNADFGTVTMANTIIAGNFAAGNCGLNGCFPPGTDCFAFAPRNAGITSKGYNLIQTPAACDLVGDTTGNLLGLDPRLGLLANNGGATASHALAAGSPAIDAASPAAPGSGVPACALTDQRHLLRPIGARCDMGAVERSADLALATISPHSGGNAGQVSVQVGGDGFVDGASVTLRRAGQPDIVGTQVEVDVAGSTIAATFDLIGRPTGAWDAVVKNPDATARTLSGAFAVQAGVGPKLWVDVIGVIKRRSLSIVTVMYGNSGDANAKAVPLALSLPVGHSMARLFAVAPPPLRAGQTRPDWNSVPLVVAQPGASSYLQVPVLLPIVPSGYSGILRLALSMPGVAVDTFMVASIGDPAYVAAPSATFVAQAVAGAQDYLRQVFGIVVPAALVPDLHQYATLQLQDVVTSGGAAFAAALGTEPPVYSMAQLQLDLALYAALRVGGSAP
jgi:hypothetical protein